MFINTAMITLFRTALSIIHPRSNVPKTDRATDSICLLQFLMISLMSQYESTWGTLKLSQFDVRQDRVSFADLLAKDNIYLLTICYYPRHEQHYSANH